MRANPPAPGGSVILDDDQIRLNWLKRLELKCVFFYLKHGRKSLPWLIDPLFRFFDFLQDLQVLFTRLRFFFILVLATAIAFLLETTAIFAGTCAGYWMLIWRFYLGEFLIIFAVVGWSLNSLALSVASHDPEPWIQVSEYLS